MNPEKQLLIDVITFEPQRQSLTEALQGSGPFTVKGILQRAEVKNQNGRSYPFSILQREVEKYNETFVKERRALGELDHPACISSGDIMTYEGWKDIKDVKVGELIPTLNTTTNTLEYNPIEKVINEPYKGKMISIKGKNIDILVTPNHRFILNDRYGKVLEKTAQEILELSYTNKFPHLSIPIVADNWNGKPIDTFVIPGVKLSNHATIPNREKCEKDLVLNASAWFSFLGFYLAEGYCYNREKDKNSFSVSICQNEGIIADNFRKILNELSPELEWHENTPRENFVIFTVYDARLWTYLSKLGNKYTKYIPQEIKDASVDLLQNLYDWFVNGDGTVVGEYERTSIFSVSKKLMEDFYEIILKLGMTGVIMTVITEKDYLFAGRLIEAKNKVPLYRLWIRSSKAIHLDFRFIKVEEIDYDDRVYCVSVKNGTFYCRNNNKCFWSGNSEIVNLKNVSHNVIDLNWEGKDLIGTLEILSTPSGNILKELFKSNIRVGISSRGVGTLKKLAEGTEQVQDDFSLISFDVVSNPSTRGSFLFPTNNLQLQESVIRNPVNGKWVTAENIIQDIFNEIN